MQFPCAEIPFLLNIRSHKNPPPGKQARDFFVFSCFSCIFARVREPSASSRGCRHTPAHAACRTLTNVAPVFSVASGIFALFPDNEHGMDKSEIVILIFSRTNDARFFSLFSPAFHKPPCPQGLPDKTQKPMFRRTWAFVGAMEGTRTPALLIRRGNSLFAIAVFCYFHSIHRYIFAFSFFFAQFSDLKTKDGQWTCPGYLPWLARCFFIYFSLPSIFSFPH